MIRPLAALICVVHHVQFLVEGIAGDIDGHCFAQLFFTLGAILYLSKPSRKKMF